MIDIPNEENAMSYYKIRQQLQKLGDEMLQFIHQPRYLLPYLQPGRLVHVSCFCKKDIFLKQSRFSVLYICELLTGEISRSTYDRT